MAYKAINNVFVNGDTVPAGKVFDLDEETAKGFLERGSVVEYHEGDDEQAETKPEVRSGDVLDSFEIGGNTYKKLQDSVSVFYSLNDVEVDESAYENAKQALVREQLESTAVDHTQVNDSEEVETAEDPLSTTVQDGPQSPSDQSDQKTESTTENTQVHSEPTSTNLHLG